MVKAKTVTFSMNQETINLLEQLARETGLNKSAVLKVLIKNGKSCKAINALMEEQDGEIER